MRIAYFDCASGISGDMTLGALVDAGAPLAKIQSVIDRLELPGCRLVASEVKKLGFRATQIKVDYEPETKHRHLHHITAMIDRALPPGARERATHVFQKLGEAEAKVHGTTIDKVHFHEVGAADSIADIVGSALALELLGVERIVASPVPTGRGFVEIAHGRCSIPAPATSELLRGIPIATSDIDGELTTPTGAAILAALADEFGGIPEMTVHRIGYGAGQKDFPQPNILRVMIGQVADAISAANDATKPSTETIVVLETNLDDVAGTVIGRCVEQLWAAGALDVTLIPVQMKKGRPGIQLSVQAVPGDADKLEAVLFAETPTLGIRRTNVMRTVLARRPHEVATAFGPVAGKISFLPDGSRRFTPEYEVCRRIAIDAASSLSDVMSAAEAAFQAEGQQ
jgi:uncharacterized protein (TIGR00299 family) protein